MTALLRSGSQLVSEIIRQWPSSRPFDARRAQKGLSERSTSDSKVLLGLALEEFLDESRSREVNPAEFAGRFPEIESVLLSRIVRFQSTGSDASRFEGWPGSGDSVGPFRLRELLGAGAFSLVFRANDQSMGSREVAVKLSGKETREPHILGNLTHPRIAVAYARTQAEYNGQQLSCITMPFCGHATASDVAALVPELHLQPSTLSSFGMVSRSRYRHLVSDVVLQVADGLDYVHRSGLLHLDVKPSNVLISEAGSARLIDFDGAQPIGHADRMSMIITRELAAPETLTVAEGGERPSPSLTPAADIYSLAASAALLLGCLEEGGSLPASSPLLSARRWKQVHRVLENGMHPRPEKRYGTASAFAAALRTALQRKLTAGWLAGGSVAAASALAAATSFQSPPQDHRVALATSVADSAVSRTGDEVARLNLEAIGKIRENHLEEASQLLKEAVRLKPASIAPHFNTVVVELRKAEADRFYPPDTTSADLLSSITEPLGFAVPLDCGTLYLFAEERSGGIEATQFEEQARACYERAATEGASAKDIRERIRGLTDPPEWAKQLGRSAPPTRSGKPLHFSPAEV